MLDSAVLRIRLFSHRLGGSPVATDEGGERTGDFGKLSALRGHKIAFGLTFTTPSGVRSTLFTIAMEVVRAHYFCAMWGGELA